LLHGPRTLLRADGWRHTLGSPFAALESLSAVPFKYTPLRHRVSSLKSMPRQISLSQLSWLFNPAHS
jgi:hypothetical protein